MRVLVRADDGTDALQKSYEEVLRDRPTALVTSRPPLSFLSGAREPGLRQRQRLALDGTPSRALVTPFTGNTLT